MVREFIQRALLLLALLSVLGISMSASAATFAEIRYAQQQLQMLGYQPGAADGVMGPNTRAAIKQFQQDSLLPTVGILGPRTRAQLRKNLPDLPTLATQRRRPGESKRLSTTPPPGIISRKTKATTSQRNTPTTPTDSRRIPGSNNRP